MSELPPIRTLIDISDRQWGIHCVGTAGVRQITQTKEGPLPHGFTLIRLSNLAGNSKWNIAVCDALIGVVLAIFRLRMG